MSIPKCCIVYYGENKIIRNGVRGFYKTVRLYIFTPCISNSNKDKTK